MKERKTTLDYIRMLYISYGWVCELKTQILLAGDLDLIEKSVLGKLKEGIAESPDDSGLGSSPTQLEKSPILLLMKPGNGNPACF